MTPGVAGWALFASQAQWSMHRSGIQFDKVDCEWNRLKREQVCGLKPNLRIGFLRAERPVCSTSFDSLERFAAKRIVSQPARI
jgi:hypothetical protein